MALTAEQRGAIIADLTTNCDCWKHPGDDALLGEMPDEKLLQLKEAAGREQKMQAVANAAVRGFRDGDRAYRINPDTGQVEAKLVTSAAMHDDDDEDDDEEVKERDRENKRRMAGKGASKEYAKNEETPAPRKKPQTLEDMLRNSDPATQARFAQLQQIEQREKDRAIDQLLANVAPTDRRARGEWLQQKPLDELQMLVSMLPRAPQAEEVTRAAATQNRRRVQRPEADDDLLTVPTINWNEKGDAGTAQKQPPPPPVRNDSWEEFDEQAWLDQAPPQYRAKINNAVAIEEQERRKLIAELTANVADDEEEKRLLGVFSRMSLSDLQAFQALAPRKEDRRLPNYFGAAAPAYTPAANRAADDDILPIPTNDWQELAKAK